jgi:hypothetical protein
MSGSYKYTDVIKDYLTASGPVGSQQQASVAEFVATGNFVRH